MKYKLLYLSLFFLIASSTITSHAVERRDLLSYKADINSKPVSFQLRIGKDYFYEFDDSQAVCIYKKRFDWDHITPDSWIIDEFINREPLFESKIIHTTCGLYGEGINIKIKSSDRSYTEGELNLYAEATSDISRASSFFLRSMLNQSRTRCEQKIIDKINKIINQTGTCN